MDRTLVYPGELPGVEDFLSVQREVLREVARLAQAMTGGAIVVDGVGCFPTQPGSMAVLLSAGTCFWPTVVDGSPFGVLAADLSGATKLGGYAGETMPLVAPPAPGTDIIYLVQATFTEPDVSPAVLSYYNAANPSQPFSGPGNSGGQQYKMRVGRCAISAKAGAPASTGTASAPAADPGYVPLWLVTIPHGAASITAPMITAAPGAPRFSSRLVGGASAADLAAETAARVAGDAGLNAALIADVNNLLAAIQAEAASRATQDADEALLRAAIRPGTSVMTTYNSSTSFTVPAGITRIRVTVTGAGGGGGASGTNNAGGGGGAGGTASGFFDVAPGQTIAVTVGLSGNGGVVGGAGGNGGSTSFGGFISAGGGAGGDGGNGTCAGGGGGAGYGGQLTLVGGVGGDGSNTSLTRGGDGAASFWGGGGRAATAGGSPTLGEAYGSGGGAGYYSANISGGPGQIGVCIIEY